MRGVPQLAISAGLQRLLDALFSQHAALHDLRDLPTCWACWACWADHPSQYWPANVPGLHQAAPAAGRYFGST